MLTVRRLYFYSLSLISALVLVWGTVGMLRAILSGGPADGSALATGLSFVLVGTPIFLLHWGAVRRDIQDPEERVSRVRAVFLYSALFAAAAPIVYSLMALINRGLLSLFGQPVAGIGSELSAVDHLIAVVINAAVFFYFWRVLQADWQSGLPVDFLRDARRLYRYIWFLAGLVLFVAGVYNLLYLLLALGQASGGTPTLISGVVYLAAGIPIWAYFWNEIQASLNDPSERNSQLRLVSLYLISFLAVIGILTSVGSLFSAALRWAFGDPIAPDHFLRTYNSDIAMVVPLVVMWAYYGRMRQREVAALPDQPRQFALHRLYYYILALLGLLITFTGLYRLVSSLSELLFAGGGFSSSLRDSFSGSLAALIVGLPLWLIPWRRMQREALRRDDVGDHARRSVLRKAYLYLVLFILVIGAMVFSGRLLFTLLNALLSPSVDNLLVEVSRLILWLALDIGLLIFHWRALRADGQAAQQTLSSLHAAFPTLILTDDEKSAFASSIISALEQTAPGLPVAVNSVDRGAPDEALLAAKAILIPSDLAIDPPESLRLWLNDYEGQRILIPLPKENWHWIGWTEKDMAGLAQEAARAVRQLAEGEAVRASSRLSAWAVIGFILGGILALQIVSVLLILIISALFR